MIGVSLRPCSSSAARSAPTRPSIMSLGASASAPAAACETAVRASSSSVASLSTTPSSRSTPQWPWLVYSQRQRSVITSRSGCAALIARVASWTTPSSSQAPEPSSSFAAGQPEEHHRGDAERRGLAGLVDGGRDREVVDARQARDRRAPLGPVADEHRVDEVRRGELRLAHHRPQQAGAAEAPHAGGGKHAGSLECRAMPTRIVFVGAESILVAEDARGRREGARGHLAELRRHRRAHAHGRSRRPGHGRGQAGLRPAVARPLRDAGLTIARAGAAPGSRAVRPRSARAHVRRAGAHRPAPRAPRPRRRPARPFHVKRVGAATVSRETPQRDPGERGEGERQAREVQQRDERARRRTARASSAESAGLNGKAPRRSGSRRRARRSPRPTGPARARPPAARA